MNPQELKQSFGVVPGKSISTQQEKIITETGSHLSAVLNDLNGKLTPEFYEYVQNTFLNTQAAICLAVSAGWKQTNY